MKAMVVLAVLFAFAATEAIGMPTDKGEIRYETVMLKDAPAATINLAYRPGVVKRHPVILMLGSIENGKLPDWSPGLVDEGYMLAAFSVAHLQDPDESRRPVWLYFDARFAHSYALGGHLAAGDAGRIVDYLVSRGDIQREKIGWLGSSSTGIPGLSVVTQGPRLAAIVAFVSTGAYRQWFETWHTNKLWRDEKSDKLWPETIDLLNKYDPIDHVDKMYPTAVLMVSGGDDKVVDPKTAQSFVKAARPYYANDPERLRLVIYDGFGHNLPRDIIRMYAENWFHLYMHPTQPPPAPPAPPKDFKDSVDKTQINSANHKDVVGAE
jgi:dienelactone hydrolase